MRGVPPGRAGLIWLRARIATADQAAGLLERKLGILHAELDRLRRLEEETGREWAKRCADADQWLLRAALLTGGAAFDLAAPESPAQAELREHVTMGLRYPGHIEFQPPPSAAPVPDGVILVPARQACVVALAAACEHAAATAARRVLEQEVALTRLRVRAVRDRRLPRLRGALAEIALAVEEREREDSARLRNR